MESWLSSEREIRRRVSSILSNFPHKKMREWLVREKSGISSGKLKDAKEHFYPLLGDASPEGVKKDGNFGLTCKKNIRKLLFLIFFLGCRGHHLYKKAVAGDCYAAVVLLSVMEELNREK